MYTIQTITRLTESAAIHFDPDDDCYETIYLVIDEGGEVIIETKDYEKAQWYVACTMQIDGTESDEPDWSYGENPFDPDDLPF